MKYPLVGISGKAKAGKDTIADYLLERGWGNKVSFAGNLKKVCAEFFGIDISCFYDQTKKKEFFSSPVVLTQSLVDELVFSILGDNVSPIQVSDNIELRTPRELLQVVGTDILRKAHTDCHVLMLIRELSGRRNGFIIPDVRFPNEAKFVLENGGFLVRINRPKEFILSSNHLSETALDGWKDWSFVIENDKLGLEFLYSKIEKMLFYLSEFSWEEMTWRLDTQFGENQ